MKETTQTTLHADGLPLPDTGEMRTKISDASHFWYGREKIGKTSLASCFPDPLFLFFEPGGKFQKGITKQYCPDWKALRITMKKLEGSKRFQTIVVDTVDIMWMLAVRHICDPKGYRTPSDAEDYGATSDEVKMLFYRMLKRMEKLQRTMVFISHSKEYEIKRKGGASYHRTKPTLADPGRAVLEPYADIWAFYQFNDVGERVMHVGGDDLVAAGNRCEGRFLCARTKRPLAEIPMGGSKTAAWNNYVAAFHNRMDMSGKIVKAVKTATKKKGK